MLRKNGHRVVIEDRYLSAAHEVRGLIVVTFTAILNFLKCLYWNDCHFHENRPTAIQFSLKSSAIHFHHDNNTFRFLSSAVIAKN